MVPAGAVRARVTAARTAATAPSRFGVTAKRLRGAISTSGSANAAFTSTIASSAVRSPTLTPPIDTPGAIVCGAVVVVPVVVPDVVAATTPADNPPAAPKQIGRASW